MNIEYYERFFQNSPTAYSFHRVIFKENGTPSDYECLTYNKAYVQLMQVGEQGVLKVSSDGFCKSWTKKKNFYELVLKSLLSQTTSEIDVKCVDFKKWFRIIIVPIDKDIYSCSYQDVSKEYIPDIDIEGFLKLNIDIFCITSVKGYYVRVNQAFENILGYSVDEVEGENIENFVLEDDLLKTSDAMSILQNQQSVSKFVNRILHKDGSYRYIEWHSQPYGDYIYSSGRDITEHLKLKKELFDKNRKLGSITEKLKIKNEILKKMAIRDDLTGLYNRHFLDEKINQEIKLADTEHRPLSIIIVDLDHFKKINDTWGHPTGDMVLKKTSELLKKMVRSQDIVGRLGGEEFIIILPNTNLETAFKIAERLRKKFENHNFPIVGNLTGSFGVAEKVPFESFDRLYERVDMALYEAKESNRNCVVKATNNQ